MCVTVQACGECATWCGDMGVKHGWGGPGSPLPLAPPEGLPQLEPCPPTTAGPGPSSLRTLHKPSQDLCIPTLETVAGGGGAGCSSEAPAVSGDRSFWVSWHPAEGGGMEKGSGSEGLKPERPLGVPWPQWVEEG